MCLWTIGRSTKLEIPKTLIIMAETWRLRYLDRSCWYSWKYPLKFCSLCGPMMKSFLDFKTINTFGDAEKVFENPTHWNPWSTTAKKCACNVFPATMKHPPSVTLKLCLSRTLAAKCQKNNNFGQHNVCCARKASLLSKYHHHGWRSPCVYHQQKLIGCGPTGMVSAKTVLWWLQVSLECNGVIRSLCQENRPFLNKFLQSSRLALTVSVINSIQPPTSNTHLVSVIIWCFRFFSKIYSLMVHFQSVLQ